MHIDDIAIQHAADLDSERRGQQQTGEAGGVADAISAATQPPKQAPASTAFSR